MKLAIHLVRSSLLLQAVLAGAVRKAPLHEQRSLAKDTADYEIRPAAQEEDTDNNVVESTYKIQTYQEKEEKDSAGTADDSNMRPALQDSEDATTEDASTASLVEANTLQQEQDSDATIVVDTSKYEIRPHQQESDGVTTTTTTTTTTLTDGKVIDSTDFMKLREKIEVVKLTREQEAEETEQQEKQQAAAEEAQANAEADAKLITAKEAAEKKYLRRVDQALAALEEAERLRSNETSPEEASRFQKRKDVALKQAKSQLEAAEKKAKIEREWKRRDISIEREKKEAIAKAEKDAFVKRAEAATEAAEKKLELAERYYEANSEGFSKRKDSKEPSENEGGEGL